MSQMIWETEWTCPCSPLENAKETHMNLAQMFGFVLQCGSYATLSSNYILFQPVRKKVYFIGAVYVVAPDYKQSW